LKTIGGEVGSPGVGSLLSHFAGQGTERRERMFRKNCRGKKIMIMEADFVDREALSMVLATEGYMVPAAANPDEARELLRCPERPDLIILDLSTHHNDVLEIHALLQGDPNLASIPVIFLTTKTVAQQPSVDCECLEKPLDSNRLLERINARLLAAVVT
jgi:CheY-like chemotaxis protein